MQVLGVDIGGSGIKGGIVDRIKGELTTERYRIDTPQPATPDAVAQALKQLADHFAWKGDIGCGFPAVIQHGVAKTAANIDSTWIDCKVSKIFSEISGSNVTVINDADAAGLAEMAFGVGQGVKGLVLLLTIGTGIGSALFNDGVLVPNTEYGHLYYRDVVLEKYAADSIRKKLDLSWEDWAKRFNQVIRYLERVINPDLIIVGGGVSKKEEKYMHFVTASTPIKIAALQNNAGIIGAAMAVHHHIH